MGIDVASYRVRIGAFRCHDPKHGCRHHYQTKHAYPYKSHVQPFFTVIEKVKKDITDDEKFTVNLKVDSQKSDSLNAPTLSKDCTNDHDAGENETATLHDGTKNRLMLSGDVETNPGPVFDVKSVCKHKLNPDLYDIKSQCISFMLYSKKCSILQSLSLETLHFIQAMGLNENLIKLTKMKTMYLCFRDKVFHLKCLKEKQLDRNTLLPEYSLVQSKNATYAIVKMRQMIYLFSVSNQDGHSQCTLTVYETQDEVIEKISFDNDTKELYYQEIKIDDKFEKGKMEKRFIRATVKYCENVDVKEPPCNGKKCMTSDTDKIKHNSHELDKDVFEVQYIANDVDESCQSLILTTAGLDNLGNTCYMNSIIQCLNAIIPRTMYLTCTNDTVGNYLIKLLKDLNSKTHSISPCNFKNEFSNVFPPLQQNTQQDSQEFLLKLLNHLRDSNFADNFINRNFLSKLTSTIKCHKCKNENISFGNELVLTLPLPTTKTDTCSIGDCLEKYFESETMAGENKYLCSHCESYQTAVKTFLFMICQKI